MAVAPIAMLFAILRPRDEGRRGLDRLRGAAPEQVAHLAASMAEVGLLSPITVHAREVVRGGIAAPGFGLVAGLHRLEAARSLGWLEIDAHVVDLPDLRRQLAECDENLCGTKLTPSDRALFTRRRKEIYEALHPETRPTSEGGRNRRQLGDDASRFTADTSSRTGRSERDVQRDATRGERIPAPVLAEVRKRIGNAILAAVQDDQDAARILR